MEKELQAEKRKMIERGKDKKDKGVEIRKGNPQKITPRIVSNVQLTSHKVVMAPPIEEEWTEVQSNMAEEKREREGTGATKTTVGASGDDK